jgi:hypothetical protein
MVHVAPDASQTLFTQQPPLPQDPPEQHASPAPPHAAQIPAPPPVQRVPAEVHVLPVQHASPAAPQATVDVLVLVTVTVTVMVPVLVPVPSLVLVAVLVRVLVTVSPLELLEHAVPHMLASAMTTKLRRQPAIVILISVPPQTLGFVAMSVGDHGQLSPSNCFAYWALPQGRKAPIKNA